LREEWRKRARLTAEKVEEKNNARWISGDGEDAAAEDDGLHFKLPAIKKVWIQKKKIYNIK
jgi:hypothetical protein